VAIGALGTIVLVIVAGALLVVLLAVTRPWNDPR
jgi:hypothetical protein